jgi:curved DNA-binding protein CbpA
MTHYEILGIPETASNEEIKRAFRKLAAEYHPDTFKGADNPFRDVQRAWEVLRDEDAKAAYDAELAAKRQAPPRYNATATKNKYESSKDRKISRERIFIAGALVLILGSIIVVGLVMSGAGELGRQALDNTRPSPTIRATPRPTARPSATPSPTPTPTPSSTPTPTPSPTSRASWRQVDTFTGSDGITKTEEFRIRGDRWRVEYAASGSGEGVVSIDRLNEQFDIENGSGEYVVEEGDGEFALTINAQDIEYTISVYDYR